MIKYPRLLVIAAVFVGTHNSLSYSQEYNFDATQSYSTLSLSSLSAMPGRILIQETATGETESTNKDWNGSKVLGYFQYDTLNSKGTHIAYVTETHANGDVSYWKFEGKQEIDDKKNANFMGFGKGIGGTGKYKSFSGRVKYECQGLVEKTICKLKGNVKY